MKRWPWGQYRATTACVEVRDDDDDDDDDVEVSVTVLFIVRLLSSTTPSPVPSSGFFAFFRFWAAPAPKKPARILRREGKKGSREVVTGRSLVEG